MSYRFASRTDHSDLASGLVLRSAPGYPAFPVRLAERLRATGGDLPSGTWVGNALDPASLAGVRTVPPPDLVVTDVPYGQQASWQGRPEPDAAPLRMLARSLCAVLPDHAVLALCAQARRISLGTGAPALQRLRVGNRAMFLGRVGDLRGVV